MQWTSKTDSVSASGPHVTLSEPRSKWSGRTGRVLRIGYARVSTAHQDLAAQVARLEDAGAQPIWQETWTGTTADRPQWAGCLRSLRPGDQLVVTRLDRIGRSLGDLVRIAAELQEREVALVVLDQAIDTSTPAGRMMFGLLATVAEYEAALISERTRASMQARPPGKRGGRPRVMTPAMVRRAIELRAAETLTMPEIARAVGVSESTLRRALKARA